MLYKRILRTALSLSIAASTALADIPQELQEVVFSGDLNARSSVDFRKSARNITAVIPRGTRGTVLETRKLSRTGSYAVKIKVTSTIPNKNKKTAQVGDESWVYFSQNDPWLAFRDKEGAEVQDPEVALTARATKDGEGIPIEGTVKNPSLPAKTEIKKQLEEKEKAQVKSQDPNLAMRNEPSKTEGDICINCDTAKAPPVVEKNVRDLQSIKDTVKAADPNNKWSNDPMIMKYSNSDEVSKTLKYAMRNKSARSKKLCYRYVKRALMGGDLVQTYPPGGHARDAVRDLKAQGMVNLLDNPKYKNMIKSPSDVPKGAVIVYHNGTRESGDVQIKTDWGDKGGYVSDFHTPNSFLKSPKARRYANIGKPYKIIGVMIKP